MFGNSYFYFQSGRWRAGCRTLHWPSSPCRTSPPDSQSSGSWWYRKPAGHPAWENNLHQLLPNSSHSRGFTPLLLFIGFICTGIIWLKLGQRGNSRWHCFSSQHTGTNHLNSNKLWWMFELILIQIFKCERCRLLTPLQHPIHVNTRAATLESCSSKHFTREKCLHTHIN